ncbi:uncharacterized protein LOC131011800 [Salvia miltiorrhiza]|uniref:uncharacterized protein LOC131011800 n=1 Tax=Salvia miltiorrhiza TaxID=226208 RepID=UPI0025ABC023|nr:uncharacterized protein LOC131011800 [Salvia miltiorrhiza]
MGSCISKCKPKKKAKHEDPIPSGRHHVLVISRDPPPEITIMPPHKPFSPAPSTSSAASFSSFSCSATSKYSAAMAASSVSSSSSSLSSSSYSTCALRDRSFSNEFLRSCAKEIPHVVNVEKTASFPNKIPSQNLDPLTTKLAPTPKKRARASSPTLVRQKSFRKEQNSPNRGLRSPSPSRRFNGDGNRIFPVQESYYRKPVVSRGNNAPKRESFRAPSPARTPKRELSIAPKTESFRAPAPAIPKRELSISREYSVRKSDAFSSKIDGREVDVVMEDINNPLIALDCFIFL